MMHRTDKTCEWHLDKPHWEICRCLAVEKRNVLAAIIGGKNTYVGVWLCQNHLESLKSQLVPKH